MQNRNVEEFKVAERVTASFLGESESANDQGAQDEMAVDDVDDGQTPFDQIEMGDINVFQNIRGAGMVQ